MNERRKERPGAILYFELIPAFDSMTDEAAGKFIKGILHFARDETEPDFSGEQGLSMLWPIVRERLENDRERYITISINNSQKRKYSAYIAKRRENGQDYLSFAEWKEQQQDK